MSEFKPSFGNFLIQIILGFKFNSKNKTTNLTFTLFLQNIYLFLYYDIKFNLNFYLIF